MPKIVSGTFNGTGAAVYICLGFIPDAFRLFAVGDTVGGEAQWSKHMRRAELIDGFLYTDKDTDRTLETAGSGIQPYEGGDTLTASNQTSTTYGEGVYLGWDLKDFKALSTKGGDMTNAALANWTLDTAGNRTGHFNTDVAGTYVGPGSRITIDGKEYTITALTAGQGISADEVTLSRAAPTGVIQAVSGKWDMAPIEIGKVTPAGVKINYTAVVNVNNEMQMFEAILFD